MMRLFRLRHIIKTKRSGIASISFQFFNLCPSPMSKRCIETGQIWRSPRDSLHRLTRPFLFLRTNKLTRICFQTLSNLSSTAFAWSSFTLLLPRLYWPYAMSLPTSWYKCYFFLAFSSRNLLRALKIFANFVSFKLCFENLYIKKERKRTNKQYFYHHIEFQN